MVKFCICIIMLNSLFFCRLYWNQSMTFMVYGKGVCLLSRYLYCHLVHIWPVKIGDNQNVMKKCIYIGFNGKSVIIPLFIKGIYLLLLCLVIMGIGIGMALPCLDALITQGIEKEQRGTVTSFYSSMRFIGVANAPPLYSFFMKGHHEVFYLTSIFAAIGAIIAIIWIKPAKDAKMVKQKPSLLHICKRIA